MSSNVKVVNLVGAVTLTTVEARAEEIRQAFETVPMVLISLSQADEIDLAGIQLLYGARRYAEAQGKELHITGAVPDQVARRLYQGGFIAEMVREGRQLDQTLSGFAKTGNLHD
ncbi:STAS domain-containing protein [Alkalispirochaeta americana]|nr:STAS domain-containing protein [Alkalispirochaeta americana]